MLENPPGALEKFIKFSPKEGLPMFGIFNNENLEKRNFFCESLNDKPRSSDDDEKV
jgi:hypothetical protein